MKKGNKNIRKNIKEKFTDDFFTKKNRSIIGIGILVIIIGFYALAQPPVNGFLTMVVAPILLVVGFLIIIPIGILFRDKELNKRKGD